MNNNKITIRIVIIRIDVKHVFYFGDKKRVFLRFLFIDVFCFKRYYVL